MNLSEVIEDRKACKALLLIKNDDEKLFIPFYIINEQCYGIHLFINSRKQIPAKEHAFEDNFEIINDNFFYQRNAMFKFIWKSYYLFKDEEQSKINDKIDNFLGLNSKKTSDIKVDNIVDDIFLKIYRNRKLA